MPDSELEGFVDLNDAQIRSAQSQGDLALKLTQAEINWQQAVKGALENLRRHMEIQWDSEARTHLVRMRTQSLQTLRKLKEERERLRKKLIHVNWLFAGGGQSESVRDGWIAFKYLRNSLPITLKAKVVNPKPPEECFSPSAWGHCVHKVEPYMGPKDGGALLEWARQNSYYPMSDGAAWTWMAIMLQSCSDAASEEAKRIDVDIDLAAKDARELENKGWDRLKVPTPVSP